MFHVDVSKKAGKSALDMPAHYQTRLEELILTLENEPVPAKLYDIKKIDTDEYRIRIGGIRIIYDVYWDKELIEVIKIEWRSKAYK